MIIPFMTFLVNIAILLDVPIFRQITVFVFLSFIPGFAILRLFRLKELSFLDVFLFSVALSIAFEMLWGLLVNALFLSLGLSRPLSTVPLTVVISAFVLTVFFIEYRRDLSQTSSSSTLRTNFEFTLRNVLILSLILFLVPLLSALSVLYLNVPLILFSCATIAVLCVLSVMSKRLIPESFYPILIFSISIALLWQGLLISKNVVGYDANLEFYVFRLTQINGYWGFLEGNAYSLAELSYNSMLSITLLPAIYSVLMHVQGETVFKILYSFLFSLVPLTLYRLFEKQFGKLIGLLSVLFFVFSFAVFYGPEPLSLNRQIVAELFFMLSFFILIDASIPKTKRRVLLLIFGIALAVSHYVLAYVFLGIVAVIFLISRVRRRFDTTLNTVTVLLLFVITLSWYAFWAISPLESLVYTVRRTITYLTGVLPTNIVSAGSFFAGPQIFTAATWINLLLSGIAYLFLMIGVLSIILRQRKISTEYYGMLILAAIVLAISLVAPGVASILNFSRFYSLSLLFLSPCFVLGGLALVKLIGKAWTRIRILPKLQITAKNKNINLGFLLVGILLSAYFLSQVGFVNRVTNGAVHSYTIDYYRMLTSNSTQDRITFYNVYIPEQDVFSASWLQKYKGETAEVFADSVTKYHSLSSYGLIPANLLLLTTNETIPLEGRFVYLGSSNIVNDIAVTNFEVFNASEILFGLDNDLVYSNGNSEIQFIAFGS
jgi:uncharacterized membrane protein